MIAQQRFCAPLRQKMHKLIAELDALDEPWRVALVLGDARSAGDTRTIGLPSLLRF